MNTGPEDREAFAAFLLRLRSKGIVSRDLVAAFEATPRRNFIPARWQSAAWSDRTVPIECGEAIEGVDLQASVVNALAIEPGNRILEIGAGSGFTAAVMSRLAGKVKTMERYRTLADLAKERMEALAITNVHVLHGDGAHGLAIQDGGRSSSLCGERLRLRISLDDDTHDLPVSKRVRERVLRAEFAGDLLEAVGSLRRLHASPLVADSHPKHHRSSGGAGTSGIGSPP